MRRLIKAAVALVVLLVLVVGLLFVYVDAIAKGAIERGATSALGVQTTLATADVGILAGDFGMTGLAVDNPEGFKSEHFMKLGSGEVAVSLGTLRKEIVELPRLVLSDIDVAIEKKATTSNYDVIIAHVKSKQPSGGSTAPEPEEGAAGKRFIIRELLITNVNVTIEMISVGGSTTTLIVPVREVRLTDVGTGPRGGVRISELVGLIFETILRAVVANAGLLPVDFVQDLGASLTGLEGLRDIGAGASFDSTHGVVDLTGDIAKLIGTIGGDAGKEFEKEIGGVLEGIGDLLGGKKKP